MLVTQAYRYALDPTPRRQRALASQCGAARYAYNWALDLVKQRLDQRAAGLEVEVPWTLPALRREWNRAKDQVAPWWRENSKEAYNSGLDALARGLKNWADSKHGRRNGRKVGFPQRKTRHRARPSCRFTTGPIRVGDASTARWPAVVAPEPPTAAGEPHRLIGSRRDGALPGRTPPS
jgi:putative transposase